MKKFWTELSIPIKTQLHSNRLKFSVYTCVEDAIYALYGLILYGLIGE